jgi:hypothetical protein
LDRARRGLGLHVDRDFVGPLGLWQVVLERVSVLVLASLHPFEVAADLARSQFYAAFGEGFG